MIIALVYDDTYTQDPLLWNWFVEEACERGHTVYCVTSRHDTDLDDIEFTLGRLLLNGHIIACNMQPKKSQTLHLGIIVDVWIDDNPKTIDPVAQPSIEIGNAKNR